jgi:hypothetical protein
MKSKGKNTIRICSSLESGLKQQWNQMFWPVKKLGCGIADCPIQDEPGEKVCFQYSVSLDGGFDSNTR